MPLSRPVLLGLVGAILVATAFFATTASRYQSDVPEADPKAQAVKAKKVNKAEAATPAKPEAAKTQADAKAEAQAKAIKAKMTQPKPAAKPKPKPKVEGVPAPVARALDKNRVIVLFFRQSGSADDRAVAGAVNAQRGSKGVAVFSDNIRRLARYRAVTGPLGISQAPAVVIVGRNGEAQVVEGFVDEGSLTQQVVDAK